MQPRQVKINGWSYEWVDTVVFDGITMKEFISQQKRISWKDAVYFTKQILSALQHAHRKGVVHRDIKPQNIMLLKDGTIKVTDFGIARFSRNETQTMTDRAIGSVHYISPEQAKGSIIDEARKSIQKNDVPEMTLDEINAEINAVRNEA